MFKSKKSKPSRYQGKKKKNDKFLACSIIGVVMVSLIGIYGMKWIVEYDLQSDSRTLCKINRPVPLVEEWIIDCTEDCSQKDLEIVKRKIQRSSEEIPENARLTIRVIGNKRGRVVMETLFDRCRPQAKAVSEFTENGNLIDKTYRREYLEPLQKAVEQIATFKGAERSPLIELFAESQLLNGLSASDAQKKTLVFVSDGLQHSNELSLYAWEYHFPPQDWIYIQEAQGSLSEVSVILYQRSNMESKPYQNNKLKNFWERYFKQICRAKSFEVVRL